MTGLKDDLLDAVGETTWYPAEARDGRFRNTVANAPDWNVSRQRYWGVRSPSGTATTAAATRSSPRARTWPSGPDSTRCPRTPTVRSSTR
ncbi:class I tRNA ligase family protein [Halosimplex aquaticum]